MLTKPERGMPITVLLADGQEHAIRFPLGILREMKATHNLDMLRNIEWGKIMDDPERLALILSYGLRSATPEATIEWVEQNVDAAMLLDIAPMLLYAASGQWVGDMRAAAEAALNGAAAHPNGGPPEAQTSQQTGSLSGQSGGTTLDSQSQTSGE